MPVCVACLRTFPTLKKVLIHVKTVHEKVEEYNCRENGCKRSFKTKHSFKRHFNLKHKGEDEKSDPAASAVFCSNTLDSNLQLPFTNQTDFNGMQNSIEADLSTFKNSENLVIEREQKKQIFHDELLKFICMLYGHSSITRNQTQKIVAGLSHLLDFSLTSIFSELTVSLTKMLGVKKEDLSIFEDIHEHFKTDLQSVSTEYKRFKKFEKCNLLIKPVPYRVGQCYGLRKKGYKRVPVPVNLYGHHVPLKQLFVTFFNSGDVLQSILDYQNSLQQDGLDLSNFIQGELWKQKTAEDSRVLIPFFIFCDDYESGNPLSSHSGIHKLCGTYVTFPTLPPEQRSKLDNIFMVLLFHASDRKKFGNLATFHVLIDEINEIHKDGIEVSTSSFEGKVFPQFVLLVGDNLGIHTICGFSESFTCKHPCHICRMEKEKLKYACVEDPSVLRNRQNYEEDVLANNVTNTGIKEICHWNKISGFFVTEGISFDVMHDLARGVIPYTLVLVLGHFVTSKTPKYFTLEFLNDRIENHDYGPLDSANTPLAISSDELLVNKTLRMTASETLVFVKHLGLIIGDKVPNGDPHWELFLHLRKILDIALAPSLCKASIEKLNSAVEDHNSLYLALSLDNLKPKHHFMTHYQRYTKLLGPLLHLWTMRGEAKLKTQKAIGNVILSRRDMTYSVSLKNQLKLMNVINSDFKQEIMDISPKGIWVKCAEVEFPESLSEAINLPEEILCTDWVRFKGTVYAEGTIVIKEIQDGMPVFLFIRTIFLNQSEDIFFICDNVQIIEFNTHFHSYKVELLQSSSLIECQKIIYYSPCAISVLSNGDHFVTLRHKW